MWSARLASVVVAVLVLAGCAPPSSGEVAAGALDEAGVDVGSTWVLASGTVGGQRLQLIADRPITFTRTPDGIEGQSSCNTYAEYDIEGETPDERIFPGLANTEMLCVLPGEESLDNPIMDLEEAFLAGLYATTDVEVDDDELRLAGPDSTLVFERRGPGDTSTATATARPHVLPQRSTWTLRSGNLDGQPLALLPDRPIRLFHDDGEITGQSSCNGYRGTVEPDPGPDGPAFVDLEFEAAGCVDGDEDSLDNPIMGLDEAYNTALSSTTSIEVVDDELRLRGPESLLVYDRARTRRETDDDVDATATDGDPVATAGTWVLETGVVDGIALDPVSGGRVDMMASDGQMGGRAACNEYAATYAVEGDRFDAQVTAVTEMGCPGARMDTEAAYLGALGRVTTAERTESRLTLSGDGVKLSFTAEAPLAGDGLVGVRWQLEVVVVGTTTTPAAGDGFLVLAGDGTMTGSTGCRTLSGEWTTNGSGLAFPSLAADGACRPDLVHQDGVVVGVLEDTGATVDGDRLVLDSRHGEAEGEALVYVATSDASRSDASTSPTTSATPGPTSDPTRNAGDGDTSSDALFAGTVFLWRTGGVAGVDESVTIRGDGFISVTSEDAGGHHQLDRRRLQSVAAALEAFDWDDLAARVDPAAMTDDTVTWHVNRFERELVITDAELPDPPPALLVEAAALLDEFAPDA